MSAGILMVAYGKEYEKLAAAATLLSPVITCMPCLPRHRVAASPFHDRAKVNMHFRLRGDSLITVL